MESQERHQTTPSDLGVRSQLLLDKHASYIKRVADVSELSIPGAMKLTDCFIETCEFSFACSPKTVWNPMLQSISG